MQNGERVRATSSNAPGVKKRQERGCTASTHLPSKARARETSPPDVTSPVALRLRLACSAMWSIRSVLLVVLAFIASTQVHSRLRPPATLADRPHRRSAGLRERVPAAFLSRRHSCCRRLDIWACTARRAALRAALRPAPA